MTKYILGGSILGVMIWVCGARIAERTASDSRVVVGAAVRLGAPVVSRNLSTTTSLFDAMREVESGGERMAVGDNGRSLGLYQIGRDYWQDATEFGKVDWSYDDLVWSQQHCEQVMTWYWSRYDARTDEQRARMHVAGLDGPWQECSLDYWGKVKHRMEVVE